MRNGADICVSVPNIIAGAVAISLLGFFSGPFFATGIHVGSKLFPAPVKSSALGKRSIPQYYFSHPDHSNPTGWLVGWSVGHLVS